MHRFFDRTPEVVALGLTGAVLIVGRKSSRLTSIVTAVTPRSFEHCRQYRQRAICNPTRDTVEVAVEEYRKHYLLFIRTKVADWASCVQIDAIEHKGVDYDRPSKVCQALGLARPLTGRLEIEGTDTKVTVVRIRWDDE